MTSIITTREIPRAQALRADLPSLALGLESFEALEAFDLGNEDSIEPFIQMHYLNTSPTDEITVHATINGETYAPEEQYRASGIQGPWTDVYATAATMYHAVTGQLPQPALDRQAEDKLKRPRDLGIQIEPRAEAALSALRAAGESAQYIGEVRRGSGGVIFTS